MFCVVAVLMTLPAPGVLAQDDPRVQEIIVTARKKAESLRDVPVAITAFSAESIEEAGIRDLYDVAELTPGLSFFNAQGEFLAVPVIRGMAPTDIFGENNAAIFVDGIYVSGREGLNFSQLDLERIEVVKGPQSALYGRNAFSGAINYVTRMPSDSLGLKAEVTGGSDGRKGGQAAISGPLTQQLSGRMSLLYDEFDGSYDNPLGGQDIGGYRYRSVQGKLHWAPADSFSVTGALYYSNDEIDDSATTAYPANCENRVDANPGAQRLLDFCGRIPSMERYADTLRGIGTPSALYVADALSDEAIPKIASALGEDRDLVRGQLTINWEVAGGTLTALSGYSNTEQKALVDGNRSLGTGLPFVYCTDTMEIGPGAYICNRVGGEFPFDRLTSGVLQLQQESETREISQEIRFSSRQDQALRWSTGVYWYDVKRDVRERGAEATNQLGVPAFPDNQFGPVVAAFPVIIGEAAFRDWFRPGGNADPLERHIQEFRDDSWSVFAAADLDMNEDLTLDAQLRYGHESKKARGFEWDKDDLSVADPLHSDEARDSWDALTWRLGAKYHVSPNWMTYASVSRGKKSGGFDVTPVTYADATSGIIIKSFGAEKLLATEWGIKGHTPDGRLAMDVSVYYNDWKDIVIPEVYESNPFDGRTFQSPTSFNGNLGSATIIGLEAVANVQLTDELSMRLSGSYTDATWDSGTRVETLADFPGFRPADCQGAVSDPAAEASCRARAGDISGNTMLRQPKWQGSAGLEYRRMLAGGWSLYGRTDLSYQGKVYAGNNNLSWLPEHTYVNVKLGIESGRYSVELWGRNIFNDDAPVAVYRDVFFNNATDVYQQAAPSSTPDDFFPWRLTVSHPRLATWGLTARVRFGGEER